MKPLIGLTMSYVPPMRYNNRSGWAFIPEPYLLAVRDAGGVPVAIPNVIEAAEALVPQLAGIVLIGGADLDPTYYTDEPTHPTVYGLNPHRDTTELFLARFAAQYERPLLGVCRGVQVMNVALGGTLIQDIPSSVTGAITHSTPDGASPVYHDISVVADSRLGEILGNLRVQINTFHHQSIAKVAHPLKVTAVSDDGVIEAVENPEHPFFLGVQWHPELMAAEDQGQANLFRALVETASRKSAGR